MPHITICPTCGHEYQERDERATAGDRCCPACWSAQARKYEQRVPAPFKPIKNTCKTCGAEIAWVRTRSGHSMPVNAETWEPGDEDFNPKKHTSHFATCPQAGQHRRQRL